MVMITRIELGSSVRRVKVKQPKGGDIVPALAYEHIYRELIIVEEGGPDQGLPPMQPGKPEVGIPSFPDQGLPEEPPFVDNTLPDFDVGGWPGCPGHVDNTLPTPPSYPDHTLPDVPPGVWGGAPSHPDQSLPGAPPEVWGGAPSSPDNTLPPEAQPK